jgi:hypothetical protein
MAVAYNPTPINWAQLNSIGTNIGQGMQNRRLRGAIGPNGEIDFKALWEADPLTALKYKIAQDEANALAGYREGQLANAAAPSLDEKIYNDWQQSQQPSYLGPQEDTTEAAVEAEEAEAAAPAAPPGMSYTRPTGLENAPKLVQDKLMSNRELAREDQIGKGEGDSEAFRARLEKSGPEVDDLISQLTAVTRTADEGTFEHALGDYQGAAPTDDWRDTLTSGIPRALGSVSNYLEKGFEHGFIKPGGDFKDPVKDLPGGYTSTLRSQVLAAQASIVNVMQRLLRVPGIGAQSDAELKQIILQSGELSKAPNKAEFHARLGDLMSRLKALGFNVKIPSLEQVAGGGPSEPKIAERLTPEAPTAPVVQGSAAPGVNENTMVGGENIGRTTSQPPTPPKRALNALKAYQNNPQARAAFDEIYGPGAADFYLQKYR